MKQDTAIALYVLVALVLIIVAIFSAAALKAYPALSWVVLMSSLTSCLMVGNSSKAINFIQRKLEK
jgi:hypothetical protein